MSVALTVYMRRGAAAGCPYLGLATRVIRNLLTDTDTIANAGVCPRIIMASIYYLFYMFSETQFPFCSILQLNLPY